jgi:chromosome segregation ATPase
MLECGYKECNLNNNGVCVNPTFAKDRCKNRTKSTKTLNYAEEQLNNAIEKEKKKNEKVCYTEDCQHNKDNECQAGKANCLAAKPINYEEEYYKLKKENEELKSLNHTQSQSIKDMQKDIENYKFTNTSLQTTNKELHEEIDQVMEEKENLKTIIKGKQEVERDNEKLRNLLFDKGTEVSKQLKQIEELQKVNKQINDHNIYLKKEVEEENEVLENEYHNKIFLAEQKINSLSTEVACLKVFKEKDNKQIQNLKDAVKKLAEVL